MDDMLQVVWDRDPEAVIDAFEAEIGDLRVKLEKAERSADQFKFESGLRENNLIEQDGYLRAAEASSAALLNALNAVLDPDNIAKIAHEKSIILAMKFMFNAMGLPRDKVSTAMITRVRKYVQAIWQVEIDSAQKTHDIYANKEQ